MFARRRELLEREAERLGALAVRGDVTNPADLERLVERTLEAFGGIDVLVKTAAARRARPRRAHAEQLEEAVELLLVVGRPARPGSACRTCGQSGRGRVDQHHLELGARADRRTSRSRTPSAPA